MPTQSPDLRRLIKGNSRLLRDALTRLQRAARVHRTSILIEGETGTGKDLAARLVHEASQRDGQFVPFNCATIPKDLMDSELFGSVCGAFTGARDHPGLFEQADKGTLFLDEIGEMPAELQAKVLRAIETGEIRRLGSTRVRQVDVRVVCATHGDLRTMVKKREFRADLLYRIAGYVVRLPPLRERGRDSVLLARHILRSTFPGKQISRDAEVTLLAYAWPGNVRELQNVVCAAGIDAGRTIRPEHLVRHLDHRQGSAGPRPSLADQLLMVVDRAGSASMVEIRDETSRPRTTLRRVLHEMMADGVLRRDGQAPHTRYTRADATDEKSLTARQRDILHRVTAVGRITRFGCAEHTGTSIRTASRDLAQLVELGYLVREGASNAAGYVSTSR